MTPPTLESERLILRPNRESDFERYAEFYASPRAATRGGNRTRNEAWTCFAAEVGHWVRGYGWWGIERKADGAYCGQAGLYNPEGWPEPEIGWLVWTEFEGMGIACEAALRARAYAFDELGWTRAASCISPGNERSERLAARMGARFDREAPGPSGRPMRVWLHPHPKEAAA